MTDMLEPLSSPAHAENCDNPRFTPLRRAVQELSAKSYAERIYGWWTHYTFVLSTAPSYEEAKDPGHWDVLAIMFLPDQQRFLIGYSKTADSEWGMWLRPGESEWVYAGEWKRCTEVEVVPLVDEIVMRDLDAFDKRNQPDSSC
jgi:hypothetical protein